MAFIYLAGGQDLQPSQSREEVEKDVELARAERNTLLRYEVGSAGWPTHPMHVTVLAANIATVADEPRSASRANASPRLAISQPVSFRFRLASRATARCAVWRRHGCH